jgi:hypothetical protein
MSEHRMAKADEWFTNERWDAAEQATFFRRLARAKSKRLYYARAKAGYLARTGETGLRAGIALLGKVLSGANLLDAGTTASCPGRSRAEPTSGRPPARVRSQARREPVARRVRRRQRVPERARSAWAAQRRAPVRRARGRRAPRGA